MRNTHYIIAEENLIRDCLNGDQHAQYELYQKYVQAMYNVAVRMVHNQADAEDIMQEVFIKVFQKLDSFQGESTLGAWIKKITINTSINFIRKAKKQQVVLMEEAPPISKMEEDFPVARYSMTQIHHAIKQLPERCRVVLSLFLIEGYQHKEIAQILKITESTSKTQYRRGRQLLQEILKD